MLSRAGKLSTNQKSRIIRFKKIIFMKCRRVDNGAIFDPSLSSSTFIGLDTQKPIDIATVHSSQNIFDSTVGIINKIKVKHRKHEMYHLFDLNNTSKSSTATSSAPSSSQMIGRSNNLTSLFMMFFGLFSGFGDAFTLHNPI